MINTTFLLIRTPLRKITYLLALFVILFGVVSQTVSLVYADGLSQSELKALSEYPNWMASSCSDAFVTLGTVTVVNAGEGVWDSGLKAPYVLEQFAIETLKDVAQKTGVSASAVVTQEHVIALLAFMFGEGGDINNGDLFNPLNTGIYDPALISGVASSVGVQSFKSFDAGVEATARTIVGSYQTRLAAALIQPQSTAEQFMYALTYYKQYQGNLAWASASEPPNQDSYYQQRLQIVQQVRSAYADIAGLIIGTPDKEQLLNKTDKSLLVYDGSSECLGGSLVNTALGLAWPDYLAAEIRGNEMSDATVAYQEAMPKYNGSKGNNEWSDCGVFVATVMRASGSDPNYPVRGTSIQYQYIVDHPEIYEIFTDIKDTSRLKPGDIFINSQHTYIYVGLQSSGQNSVSASLGDYVPQARNATFTNTLNGITEDFKIVRMR